jgi:predicted lipoprotein with Yx(FWY)xxD motif
VAVVEGGRRRGRLRLAVSCGLLAVAGIVAAACGSTGTTGTTSTSAGTVATTVATTPTSSSSSTAATRIVTTIHSGSLGTILVNIQGQVLYTFTHDGTNAPCDATCLQVWPAALVPLGVTAPSGPTSVGTLGVTTMNGIKQLTVNGLALYTYAGDSAPGVANGNNLGTFGGVWKVVKVG